MEFVWVLFIWFRLDQIWCHKCVYKIVVNFCISKRKSLFCTFGWKYIQFNSKQIKSIVFQIDPTTYNIPEVKQRTCREQYALMSADRAWQKVNHLRLLPSYNSTDMADQRYWQILLNRELPCQCWEYSTQQKSQRHRNWMSRNRLLWAWYRNRDPWRNADSPQNNTGRTGPSMRPWRRSYQGPSSGTVPELEQGSCKLSIPGTCLSCLEILSVMLIVLCVNLRGKKHYRSGTVNSNTVNSKFHLIQSFFEIFATFLLFHV